MTTTSANGEDVTMLDDLICEKWLALAWAEGHRAKLPADTKQPGPDVRERAETVLAWIIDNPRHTRTQISEGIGMSKGQLNDHMAVLMTKKQVRKLRVRGVDYYEQAHQ